MRVFFVLIRKLKNFYSVGLIWIVKFGLWRWFLVFLYGIWCRIEFVIVVFIVLVVLVLIFFGDLVVVFVVELLLNFKFFYYVLRVQISQSCVCGGRICRDIWYKVDLKLCLFDQILFFFDEFLVFYFQFVVDYYFFIVGWYCVVCCFCDGVCYCN